MRYAPLAAAAASLAVTACASRLPPIQPSFDNCLIENVVAVNMLEIELDSIKSRGDYQALLARDRTVRKTLLDDLLAARADMFDDERLDEAETASRMSTMLQRYKPGVDARWEIASVQRITGPQLARSAKTCAEGIE